MADMYSMTIKGAFELAQTLKRLGEGVDSVSLDEAGEYLTRFYSGQVFASRGGIIGETWPSLSDNYAAQKAKVWPGRPTLIRTGLIQRSFEYDINPARLRIRNTVDYFKYHQSGKARSKIPRRVMLKLTAGLRRDVRDILDKRLMRELRGV